VTARERRGDRIIRPAKLDGDFTTITNTALRDDRLSFAARGLLAEILTNVDGWDQLSTEALIERAAKTGNARSARQARGSVRELEAAGYRHRIWQRQRNGRTRTTYDHYLEPVRPCAEPCCATCHGYGGRRHAANGSDQAQRGIIAGGTNSTFDGSWLAGDQPTANGQLVRPAKQRERQATPTRSFTGAIQKTIRTRRPALGLRP
jgi:hypothetical protein